MYKDNPVFGPRGFNTDGAVNPVFGSFADAPMFVFGKSSADAGGAGGATPGGSAGTPLFVFGRGGSNSHGAGGPVPGGAAPKGEDAPPPWPPSEPATAPPSTAGEQPVGGPAESNDELDDVWTRICHSSAAGPCTAALIWDVPVKQVQTLARGATRVLIQTRGRKDEAVVSKPNAYPIQDIRRADTIGSGRSLFATEVESFWTGPPQVLRHLCHSKLDADSIGNGSLEARVYHGKDNYQGLHWMRQGAAQEDLCRWAWDGPNQDLELYINVAAPAPPLVPTPARAAPGFGTQVDGVATDKPQPQPQPSVQPPPLFVFGSQPQQSRDPPLLQPPTQESSQPETGPEQQPQPQSPQLQVGATVRLHGLQGACHLNGELGCCQQWDEDKGRWLVQLQSGEVKSLMSHNLQVAPPELATAALPATVNSIPALCRILKSKDLQDQITATQKFRKMLSAEKDPPIQEWICQEVVAAGMVPLLLTLVQTQSRPDLHFEAAWILTIIASVASEQVSFLLKVGALPVLVKLLHSRGSDVKRQSIWAMGHLARDSLQARKELVAEGAPQLVANFLCQGEFEAIGIDFLRHATWTLSNLCQVTPRPAFASVAPALEAFVKGLASRDVEVRVGACKGLECLSAGSQEGRAALIKCGVPQQVVRLLGRRETALQTAALRVVGNLCEGEAQQMQAVIQCGVIPVLKQLLRHTKKTIVKDACWIVSNIATGTTQQIHELLSGGVINPILDALSSDSEDVRKEAAWAISTAIVGGSPGQVAKIVGESECVKTIFTALAAVDNDTSVQLLMAVECIVKAGEHKQAERQLARNPFTLVIVQSQGIASLRQMAKHCHTGISKIAKSILDRCFPVGQEGPVGGGSSWECRQCGEFNKGLRIVCNNCGWKKLGPQADQAREKSSVEAELQALKQRLVAEEKRRATAERLAEQAAEREREELKAEIRACIQALASLPEEDRKAKLRQIKSQYHPDGQRVKNPKMTALFTELSQYVNAFCHVHLRRDCKVCHPMTRAS